MSDLDYILEKISQHIATLQTRVRWLEEKGETNKLLIIELVLKELEVKSRNF